MGSKILQHEEMKNFFGEQSTLREVIQSLELEFQKANEVVCQIKVNGVPLSEADEIKYGGTLVADISSIEVTTKNPRSILTEVVENWVIEIPRMIVQNDQLSQELRFKGVEGNLKRLIDLVDGCQLLIDSIISMQSLFETLKTMKSENWKSAQKLAASAIGEALLAFQKKDFNLMADVLEYDLGHALQIWLDLLSLIQKEVSQDGLQECMIENVKDSDQANASKISLGAEPVAISGGDSNINERAESKPTSEVPNDGHARSGQKWNLGTA